MNIPDAVLRLPVKTSEGMVPLDWTWNRLLEAAGEDEFHSFAVAMVDMARQMTTTTGPRVLRTLAYNFGYIMGLSEARLTFKHARKIVDMMMLLEIQAIASGDALDDARIDDLRSAVQQYERFLSRG